MKVLGIHTGHDSSAALVIDGRICADVAEERFARTKHYSGLPVNAVEYCLRSQGVTMADLDAVAIPSVALPVGMDYLLHLKGGRRSPASLREKMAKAAHSILGSSQVRPPLYVKTFPLAPRTELTHVEHHLAHAACAYYTSGRREKQVIVTIDGLGDDISGAIWRGEDGRITKLQAFPPSGSLGWFYGNVTEALGWWHGDGEGKTMGLAPYGDHTKCEGVLDRLVPHYRHGQLHRAHNFGRTCRWSENGADQWHFEDAYQIQAMVNRYGRENIAAEGQRVLEEQIKQIVFHWMEKEGTRDLSTAGGVFLNVKLNQRLWESGRIDHHHTFPNAGDSGLAAGAALWVYYQANPSAPIHPIEDLYWGPEYSDNEIEATLALRQVQYRHLDDVASFAAEQLAANKIVAWFQGRMESGPRALGARSILMSANRQENKDTINARVKFREAFRPFCPSLLWERREEYLEKARDEFFMITSFTCRERKRKSIPAVVHADHTLRPQTVKREFAPHFWRLLANFDKRTGEGVLLNTSFNVMGEPIVNHPREAIRCFYDNGLDHLVMGHYVISKRS